MPPLAECPAVCPSPKRPGPGVLTLLRSRSRSSRTAFMVALVRVSSSSLLHSMAVRLSFSSLSLASSFSHRHRSSVRLGYRSRPSTPSISSTVCKTWKQREATWITLERGWQKAGGAGAGAHRGWVLELPYCKPRLWKAATPQIILSLVSVMCQHCTCAVQQPSEQEKHSQSFLLHDHHGPTHNCPSPSPSFQLQDGWRRYTAGRGQLPLHMTRTQHKVANCTPT